MRRQSSSMRLSHQVVVSSVQAKVDAGASPDERLKHYAQRDKFILEKMEIPNQTSSDICRRSKGWCHGRGGRMMRLGIRTSLKKEIHALFGKADAFDTPKPERLMHRIIQIATDPGDLVLDSFAGSGTTGAVAHKMGRRWIMVELGSQAQSSSRAAAEKSYRRPGRRRRHRSGQLGGRRRLSLLSSGAVVVGEGPFQ